MCSRFHGKWKNKLFETEQDFSFSPTWSILANFMGLIKKSWNITFARVQLPWQRFYLVNLLVRPLYRIISLFTLFHPESEFCVHVHFFNYSLKKTCLYLKKTHFNTKTFFDIFVEQPQNDFFNLNWNILPPNTLAEHFGSSTYFHHENNAEMKNYFSQKNQFQMLSEKYFTSRSLLFSPNFIGGFVSLALSLIFQST